MPLRARRRRARAAGLLIVLLCVAGIGWGVHYISYLPQFSVQTVAVSGTEKVPPKLVEEYVNTILDDGSYHFLSRKNILLYPQAVIERAVVGFFPRIASVSVSRSSVASTELLVAVTERQPFALWCDSSGGCYQMDKDGFVFAEIPASAASSTEYTFRGGIATSTNPIGQTFIPAHLPALISFLNGLGQAGFTPLGAAIESDTDFSVPLQRGLVLKASFGENADLLVKNLNLVLSSDALADKTNDLEYVDLRFGDRVYYKLKGEAETTGASQ